MKPPAKFSRIIDRKRYDVATATLLAGNDYWDGHNFERRGTNQFLYLTPRGNYFTVYLTQWQGDQESLSPATLDEAVDLFEGPLSEHRVSYEDAFPGVEIEEA